MNKKWPTFFNLQYLLVRVDRERVLQGLHGTHPYYSRHEDDRCSFKHNKQRASDTNPHLLIAFSMRHPQQGRSALSYIRPFPGPPLVKPVGIQGTIHIYTCIWMSVPRSLPRMELMLGLQRSDIGGRCVIRMRAFAFSVGRTSPRSNCGFGSPSAAGASDMTIPPCPSSMSEMIRVCTSPNASHISLNAKGEGREGAFIVVVRKQRHGNAHQYSRK